MSSLYHDSHRRLQHQFDTTRLADRLEAVKVHAALTPDDQAFIERMDLFFLATADAAGHPNCSYKGGDPGFVRVVDPATIAFPNYDGNGMYLSMGNLQENPNVGLLFIDFERPRRVRLNGVASIDPADPLLAHYPEAQFVGRVQVHQVFPNCPRYIHQYQRVARSQFVPRSGCATPVPDWKRSPWAKDVLPANDPAQEKT